MVRARVVRHVIGILINDVTRFVVGSPGPEEGVFFFWTHFRLSRWMAMHLRMRSTTPFVYLDLEKGVLNMIE